MATNTDFPTGTYVKGDRVRVARTASEAVAAVWDGFKLTSDEASQERADYRDLQQQAKALGIPANQSKGDLVAAIAAYEPEDDQTPADEPVDE